LLDALDKIVLEHGGRLNLAKEARMSPEMFRNSYKKIVRTGSFCSSQTERLEFL
jgi:hypothetical protein